MVLRRYYCFVLGTLVVVPHWPNREGIYLSSISFMREMNVIYFVVLKLKEVATMIPVCSTFSTYRKKFVLSKYILGLPANVRLEQSLIAIRWHIAPVCFYSSFDNDLISL